MADALQTLKKVMPGLKVKVSKNPEFVSPAQRQAAARKEMVKAQKQTQKDIKARVLAAGNELDPRVMKMREIKETYNLRGIDIVELLAQQGYPITRAALQGALQGNVKGSDPRKWSAVRDVDENFNHLDSLLIEFKKMEFRLKVECKRFLNRDMRSIIESWYTDLGITGGSRERKLGEVVMTNYTTIYKWYKENIFPKSMLYIIQIQKVVDDIKIEAAMRKKYMNKVKKDKELNRKLGERVSTTRALH